MIPTKSAEMISVFQASIFKIKTSDGRSPYSIGFVKGNRKLLSQFLKSALECVVPSDLLLPKRKEYAPSVNVCFDYR